MIPASFVSYTLTQPVARVARVAEIADAKEKAAKDRAVRVLTDERMYPLEDLQKCEEHFQKVSAYVEARREIISHAKGARILPDVIPEDVWKSLDILCRTAPAMYLEARLKVTIGVIADAYKRKGMSGAYRSSIDEAANPGSGRPIWDLHLVCGRGPEGIQGKAGGEK